MLALPERRVIVDDPARLADWAELSCLLRPEGEVSVGDLADFLHNSLLLAEQPGSSNWEEAEHRSQEVLKQFSRRKKRLGDGYPFSVSPKHLASSVTWEEALCFTSLLAVDLGRFYLVGDSRSESSALEFRRLFESIAQAALARVFKGTSVRFGWPPEPGWPKGIKERVIRLADELGLEADQPEKKTKPKDKDLGLDVVVRCRIGDESAGSGIILVQCATGENWETKTDEPYLEEWKSMLYWNSHLVRAVAFPWRQDDSEAWVRLARRFPGILFDRLRLLSAGNPDKLLPTHAVVKIRKWCSNKLRKFPH